MKDCSSSVASIVKGDKLSLNQCLKKNDLEKESIKKYSICFSSWKPYICSRLYKT